MACIPLAQSAIPLLPPPRAISGSRRLCWLSGHSRFVLRRRPRGPFRRGNPSRYVQGRLAASTPTLPGGNTVLPPGLRMPTSAFHSVFGRVRLVRLSVSRNGTFASQGASSPLPGIPIVEPAAQWWAMSRISWRRIKMAARSSRLRRERPGGHLSRSHCASRVAIPIVVHPRNRVKKTFPAAKRALRPRPPVVECL